MWAYIMDVFTFGGFDLWGSPAVSVPTPRFKTCKTKNRLAVRFQHCCHCATVTDRKSCCTKSGTPPHGQ